MGRRTTGIVFVALAACTDPTFEHPPGPPNVLLFRVAPIEVDVGDTLELSWRVEGANTVTLFGAAAEPIAVEAKGTTNVVATSSGGIELVAVGAGGERRARADYRVRVLRPVEIVTFSADPLLIRPGEPVRVAWRAQNATRVRIRTDQGVVLFDGDAPRGGLVYRPDDTVSIELTAEGFQGPKKATVAILAEPGLPFIHRFEVKPAVTTDIRDTEIEWEVSRADEIRLFEIIAGSPVELLRRIGTNLPDGVAIPSEPGTRLFRINAINGAGTASRDASAVVLARDRPQILSLTVTPTITGPGGFVRIDWRTRDAREVTLVYNGQQIGGAQPLAGSLGIGAISSGSIEVIAVDDFGEVAQQSVHLEVDQGRPRILDFTITPDIVASGTPVEIFIRHVGADVLTLRTELGVDIPTLPGLTFYTPTETTLLELTAANSFGATIALRRVAVDEPPTVVRFDAWSDAVRQQRFHRVTWSALDAFTASHTHGGIETPVDPVGGTRGIRITGNSDFVDQLTLRGASGLIGSATVGVAVLPRLWRLDAEVEPNDHFAIAHEVDAFRSEVISGAVGVGDVDHYVVSLTDRHRLLVQTTPGTTTCQGVRVLVYDEGPGGVPIGPRVIVGSAGVCPNLDVNEQPLLADVGTPALIVIERPIDLPGADESPYLLSVRDEIRACGDAVIDRAETCDDANLTSGDGCNGVCHIEGLDDIEPNQSSNAASPATIGTAMSGHLAPADTDYWRFEVTAADVGPFRIAILPDTPNGPCALDAIVTLYSNSTLIARAGEDGNGCPVLDGPRMVLESGSHFVQINAGNAETLSARGAYRLMITAGP